MKALIIGDKVTGEASIYHRTVREQLKALGVKYENSTVGPLLNNTEYSRISASYDFIVIPRESNNYYKALIDSALITIPVFIMSPANGVLSNISASVGAADGISGFADEFFSSPFFTSRYSAVYAQWATLTTGTAIISSQATSPLTDAAQANSGKSCMWRSTKAGAGGLYVSLIDASIIPGFALMLKYAINAGDFTAAQLSDLRQLPVSVEMDHVIGLYAYNNVTVLNRWLSLIPANAMIWCGVNNLPYVTTMSADVRAALQQAYAQKKLRFCYHSHDSGSQKLTGAWPYAGRGGTLAASGVTYAAEKTHYEDIKTAWEAKGLTLDDDFYYVPATNMWDEQSLQMLSPYTSLASDPANAVSAPGKGCRVVRMASSNNASRPCQLPGQYPKNAHFTRDFVRGMTLVPASDAAAEDANATVGNWRQRFQLLMHALHFGHGYYFHDEDFIDPQTPKTGEFGVEALTQVLELKTYMGGLCEFFADQTAYAIQPNWR